MTKAAPNVVFISMKLLSKMLADIKKFTDLVTDLNKNSDQEAFAKMIDQHRVKLTGLYEQLRAALANVPPDEAHCCQCMVLLLFLSLSLCAKP